MIAHVKVVLSGCSTVNHLKGEGIEFKMVKQ